MRLYLLVTRMLLAVGFGVSDGNGERPTIGDCTQQGLNGGINIMSHSMNHTESFGRKQSRKPWCSA